MAFIPERCALMICDHGPKLIRQINLKSEDCAWGSHSVLGISTWAWAVALGVSCLAGLIVGFMIRPYLTCLAGRHQPTWVQLGETSAHVLDGETNADVYDGDPMGEAVNDDDADQMGVLTQAQKKALEKGIVT